MRTRGRFLGIAGLSLAALGTLGAQGADETPAEPADELPRQTIQGNAACLRLDRAMDFKVIDARTVIVWRSNRKDPHKITLFQGCSRLRSADAIYFDTDGWDQVCGRGGEYLMVTRPGIPRPQRPFSDRPGLPRPDPDLIEERCPVASVQVINDDVVHELLVQGGHAAPRGPEHPDQVQVVATEPDLPVD